jgi:hypothetical protein
MQQRPHREARALPVPPDRLGAGCGGPIRGVIHSVPPAASMINRFMVNSKDN